MAARCTTLDRAGASIIDWNHMRYVTTLAVLAPPLVIAAASGAEAEDPFLVSVYDGLHGSATQEAFRALAPFPVGVVYVQRPGEGEAAIRRHFCTMRRLGYTALKQIMALPTWSREDIALIALEEGIIPWWYGEAGWEPVTPALLEKLGLPRDMPIAAAREHPRMRAHQKEFLRARIMRAKKYVQAHGALPHSAAPAFAKEAGGAGPGLDPDSVEPFLTWVRDRYETIDRLNTAYSQHHSGLWPAGGMPFESWEDFSRRWENQNRREYQHLCDIFRFKAVARLKLIQERIAAFRVFDPGAPFRAGGEMALFLPMAYYGVSFEGIADLVTDCGSFYPSIHLCWHFHQVEHEVLRPVYMQASMAVDLFKGGWTASWESTGGPQQFDGGKGGEGFTVDEKTMTQLMLTYIAAGFKGFGFWCWSPRTAGKEAGEYSLLDRHNKVTPRAIRVGEIGQAARRYRDELWQARKEPLVGIYADWENEAVWAAMSVTGRDEFRQWPINARVGISRALMNANIPFEYVLVSDLRKGLAGRYRIIYLPFVLSIARDTLELLSAYVKAGGRVVIDMPSARYDERTALLSTDTGTTFEKTFGAIIGGYQYAGTNRPVRLGPLNLKGCTADMTPTHATVLARYDNGRAAITAARYGSGTAMILGYEASMMCFKPGNAAAEAYVLRHTMGAMTARFSCDRALVYRLAAPAADHYFLMNDGPQRTVSLDTQEFKYTSCEDVIEGKPLTPGSPILIEAYSGRWLRFKKTEE